MYSEIIKDIHKEQIRNDIIFWILIIISSIVLFLSFLGLLFSIISIIRVFV
jgi:hypothetical protein